MTGSAARALCPSASAITGTSRQPRMRSPLGAAGLQGDLLALLEQVRVGGEHRHPDPVRPRGRQRDPGHFAEEVVGHLEEDPGAVTAVGFGARRPAVTEVDESLDAGLDHRVRRTPGDPCDEGHPAGVVLQPEVQETALRGRCAHLFADTCIA